MTEQQIVDKINEEFNSEFKLVKAKYSTYDAAFGEYILEIKTHKTFDDSFILDLHKFYNMHRAASFMGKKMLYAVESRGKIFIYNLSDLTKAITLNKTPETLMIQKSTKLPNEKIEKLIVRLNKKEAKCTI